MSHKKRLAQLANGLSGMGHCTALRMAQAGLIHNDQPVPDAVTAAQRAFETRLTFALIDAFPERQQPTGFPWGIAAAIPTYHRLDLYPAPHAADRLLGALLPRYDHEYGGILGAPGARARITGFGWWTVYDVESNAQVRVAASLTCQPDRGRHWASTDQSPTVDVPWLTPAEHRRLRHLERLARHEPSAWLDHRDVLGSRLLRRPGLTRRLAQPHGCVNIYTHAERDVVVEWCCGPTQLEIHDGIQRSGLTAPVPGTDLLISAVEKPRNYSPSATVNVGHAQLYLRRNDNLHDKPPDTTTHQR